MASTSENGGPVIVVGYDGSATAKAAVDYAARHAGSGGHVYVVHAYGPPADWRGWPDYDRILADHQEHGRAVIDGLALGDEALLDTEWDAELLEGPATDAILRVADTRKADEIVVGSRGRGRLRSAALGSVSQDLVHRARVPVVVVPHED